MENYLNTLTTILNNQSSKKGSNKCAPQKTNTLSCITDRGNKQENFI